MEKVFDYTQSICPVCRKILPAKIYFKNGKTIMEKTCPEHGKFKALHRWDSEKLYRLISTVYTEKQEIMCSSPLKCEKCGKHPIGTKELGVFVTKKCNLKCPFCFLRRLKVSTDELYINQFRKIVKIHSDKKVIAFGSAEVSLRKDLFKILAFLKNKGFYTQIITNGIRTSDEGFVRRLKDVGIDSVGISFDLNPKAYKKLRGVSLVKQFHKSIENFKKYSINFEINAVLIKENIKDVGNLLKFAAENGAYAVSLSSYRDIINKKHYLSFGMTKKIETLCKEFNINFEELRRLVKYRYMGEKIRDYMLFDSYKTHPCHIFFHFYYKNGKLLKFNDTFEFKVLYAALNIVSKDIFLKALKKLRNINAFKRFTDNIFSRYSYYDKRMLSVAVLVFANKYDIDLRYLQNCDGFVIAKNAHIENPIPYCYLTL